MRINWLAILAVATLACAAAHAETATTAPSDLPRYRLSVGQELTYVDVGTFKYQNGSFTNGSNNTYDVISGNPEAGWHVIGRLASWFKQGDGPSEPQTTLIAFDIRADGTVTLSANGSWLPAVPPADFPALPADRSQMETGWKRDNGDGGHVTYKSLPATRPNIASFAGAREDVEDKIYLMTHESTYALDSSRGLVISNTSVDSQGYGFVGKGIDVTILATDTDQPREWLQHYAHDCDVYFAAQAKSDALTDKAELDAVQCDALFADAKTALAEARKKVTVSQVADLLDRKIAENADQASYTKQEATERAAIMNKPAPSWTLSDLAGSKHSLDEYRGKVVVLDFWYRGCGWCMKAMPQVKQLAADFAGKPVVVLGMNTDQNPADPKFVAGVFGLDYPILHISDDVVKQYHVHGFPTMFLIGPDGVIRDIHVGYSPTLHDDLSKKISELLPVK